ncbi:hypothetical protein M231_05804 [Tremella mesenterica]|uniref:Uncharacterized protein n=1 Tax=Tremella mesenterica TaxID=5217 RepID=A0A4Q1BH39_TREME|nr:uncharacterized protein TREMEDRAFT_28533 [Tremella mesenterica DSM 1558]EIW70358.1 hypothetical protein TREMEDRAFT_28533 [Tremella mesenterica DSM 1558]RXK36902.1 hypothetical protein M231_05804 [Tremella mesenterica]
MTPSYEVVPGHSVGSFKLGDTLWHTLDYLRAQKTTFPKIEISYDADNASTTSITLRLSPIILFFPHPSQTLDRIIITLPSVELSYETRLLASSQDHLTRAKVGRILGPTYAPTGGKVSYPGITFDIPMSNGRDDLVNALSVVPKEKDNEKKEVWEVLILPGKGITFHLSDTQTDIIIGQTTSQDLLLDIGPPLREFWKEDSRVSKIWIGDDALSTGYFWNYFQYGLDFLINDEGFVEKVICHSNIPGTALFQRYARCPWRIQSSTSTKPLDFTFPILEFQESLGKPSSSQYVSPNHGQEEEGMILDRSVEGGFEGVTNLGISRLRGFNGVILEEDEMSKGISSVLIYHV